MQKFSPPLLYLLGVITCLSLAYILLQYSDFGTSVIPGWHTTIFPQYYLPDLIFISLAFFQLLLILVRQVFGLQSQITTDHLEGGNKLILGISGLNLAGWWIDFITAWHDGYLYELSAFYPRLFGWNFGLYCLFAGINLLAPQLFWRRRIRRHAGWTIGICLLINLGWYVEHLSGLISAALPVNMSGY